jgi:hypothetical protein
MEYPSAIPVPRKKVKLNDPKKNVSLSASMKNRIP